MGNYIPQSYPLWAWSKTPDEGTPHSPRLVVGWWISADGDAQEVFAPTEASSKLTFRVSPFDPDAIVL